LKTIQIEGRFFIDYVLRTVKEIEEVERKSKNFRKTSSQVGEKKQLKKMFPDYWTM